MCGIAGIFRKEKPVEEAEIAAMTDALQHRGPDGRGIKLFAKGAFGHRRLSIIDLSTGAQPMCNEDEKVWITFNGEIYNYAVLRERLLALGHQFKTNSDTEVLIHGYEQWGYDLLKELRGMFAFAITDLEKQLVFVARDNFGIKPVYYTSQNDVFAFASELHTFRHVKGITRSISHEAIDDYLWFQYIPAPNTIWEEIKKLEPAHYIVYHLDGRIEAPVQYWNVDFSQKTEQSEKKWLEEAEEVIADSVKAHLVSDVPFGAFLSGGIDSTLIVSFMAQQLKQPVETFSIGFDDAAYNELKYADEAAKKFGTNHHTEIVKSDALAILSQLAQHYGEPYGDSSAIPTYYVCQLARKHVTMVLSGDGGDEGFAGYDSYKHWLKFQAINYRSGIRKQLFPLAQRILPSRYPRTDTLEQWMAQIAYFNDSDRQSIWKEDIRDGFHQKNKLFEKSFRETANFSLANKAQYMDLKTYMPYAILTKVDVASMIHSLEVRTPLIDKKVWEFAACIPEKFNIGQSSSGEWQGKSILKNLLRKRFSNEFVDRKKMGFSMPLSKWFADGGDLHTLLNDRLLSANSHVLHYFREDKIAECMKQNKSSRLWLLLFLEEWLTQNENHTN